MTLPITDHGTGVPFVWAHGLFASVAAEERDGLFPWQIIAGLRLVRYDARGHGNADAPQDAAAYEWPRLAADLLRIMDAAGLARSHVGGASMGCSTALIAALKAPDRVDRLVLGIPPTAWDTRDGQRDAYLQNAELVELGGVEMLIEQKRMLEAPTIFGERGKRLQQYAVENVAAMDERALPYVLRGAANSDLPPIEALRAISQPTLVLTWTSDPSHPVSTAERIAECIPDSHLDVASSLAEIERWPQSVAAFLQPATPDPAAHPNGIDPTGCHGHGSPLPS